MFEQSLGTVHEQSWSRGHWSRNEWYVPQLLVFLRSGRRRILLRCTIRFPLHHLRFAWKDVIRPTLVHQRHMIYLPFFRIDVGSCRRSRTRRSLFFWEPLTLESLIRPVRMNAATTMMFFSLMFIVVSLFLSLFSGPVNSSLAGRVRYEIISSRNPCL